MESRLLRLRPTRGNHLSTVLCALPEPCKALCPSPPRRGPPAGSPALCLSLWAPRLQRYCVRSLAPSPFCIIYLLILGVFQILEVKMTRLPLSVVPVHPSPSRSSLPESAGLASAPRVEAVQPPRRPHPRAEASHVAGLLSVQSETPLTPQWPSFLFLLLPHRLPPPGAAGWAGEAGAWQSAASGSSRRAPGRWSLGRVGEAPLPRPRPSACASALPAAPGHARARPRPAARICPSLVPRPQPPLPRSCRRPPVMLLHLPKAHFRAPSCCSVFPSGARPEHRVPRA